MKKLTCKCEFNDNGKCFWEEEPTTCDMQINKEIVKDILTRCKEEK